MTIRVDISPEVEAELARKAAARPEGRPKYQRLEGRKSLVELFAESPLRGLDLDISRDRR
jgi:hypothetical protein